MDDKKKLYTKADFDNYVEAVKQECERTFLKQRERIAELRDSLDEAERKNREYEGKKDLVYKAITSALKKADDIERVSLIKYNQEIAQLKSFHDKWIGYFNKIIERYPLDDDLVAASKANGKIAEVLGKTGDLDAQYEFERQMLRESLADDDADGFDLDVASGEAVANADSTADDYSDRSPAGFSFAEALHPKDDLKDIMRELGVILDED